MTTFTTRHRSWSDLQRSAHRRERRLRYGAALAAVVLPAMVAWIVLGLRVLP